MSRVIVHVGADPFLVIAPHGADCDDFNTSIVAKALALGLNGSAVINTGWSRIAGKPNLSDSLANLNNIKHCLMENGPQEEFLAPLIRIKEKIVNKFGICYVILVHGMSHKICQEVKEEVHFVVGYGQGEPPSYSCDLSYKDRLCFLLVKSGYNVYQGKAGGRFSAWNSANLNQIWRHHDVDNRVQSIQLELASFLRNVDSEAYKVGEQLATVFSRASLKFDVPSDFSLPEY